MKKYIYIILVSIITFSCTEDFLEESDRDKVIPKTVEDYSQLLYGEAYINDNSIASVVRYMTDDVTSKTGKKGWFGVTDKRESVAGYYNWQAEPEYNYSVGIAEDKNWGDLYHSILICNIVLDVADASDGSEAEKSQLKAEAYFVRAFDYFLLVNLFGEPYVNGAEMGVPINDLIGMEDVRFTRSTTGEVYTRIKSDLDKAIELFGKVNSKPTIFKGNLKASLLLASRVALYTKDWKSTIEYADDLLKISPTLKNLDKDYVNNEPFINRKNPEILYTYGYYYDGAFSQSATYFFTYSDEIDQLLSTDGDIRSRAFFKIVTGYYGSTSLAKSDVADETGAYGYAFRTAEAYLNRAEAYAEMKNISGCINDLNYLRANRFSKSADVSATTPEEALELARIERRTELCFEGHRWFDLRRQGCPRIEHKFMIDYKNVGMHEVYVLNENDAAYTLPLPLAVSEIETTMKNIKRPVRNHINK